MLFNIHVESSLLISNAGDECVVWKGLVRCNAYESASVRVFVFDCFVNNLGE